MINFFKRVVQFFLKWCAKIYLWRIKPKVIIIAGTTGRHWIKEAVKEVLEEKNFSVRVNEKNFNAELGLPLSILGLFSGNGGFWRWLKILWQAIGKISQRSITDGQEYLVLEMAIDAPKNINYLTSIVKPNAVILTTITMIYAENFENLNEIGREYGELTKSLPWNGILILNNDDLRIKELNKYFDGKIITFGFSDDSQYRAVDIRKIVDGQIFKIETRRKGKEIEDIKINRFGQHHIYAELIKAIIKDNFKERQKEFFGKIFK
jgi:UDP-N-acetylmuramyl pentapeptide synthase